MKARKTIVSVDADLQAYKAKTDARLDKAAKLAKAQAAEIEGLKARVEVLEHANTKTAPGKNQPKVETGKGKKDTKAPGKNKAKTKLEDIKSVPGCTMTITEGHGKGAGRMFVHLRFEKHPGTKVLNILKSYNFSWYWPEWSAEVSTETVAVAEAMVDMGTI